MSRKNTEWKLTSEIVSKSYICTIDTMIESISTNKERFSAFLDTYEEILTTENLFFKRNFVKNAVKKIALQYAIHYERTKSQAYIRPLNTRIATFLILI